MLTLRQVSRNFGGLAALSHVDMVVPQGKIIGLIGPNGAGKTTLLNCVSGLDHPTSGEIWFRGQKIHHYPPHRIAALGMARTYQNIRLFTEMTALQNVIVAQHLYGSSTLIHSLIQWPGYWAEEKRIRNKGIQLLEAFGLAEVQHVRAGHLSYGDQRRLEMARALAMNPVMMLLDEPTAGMNPVETEQLGSKILQMRSDGVTVLVIEHDMTLISQICNQVYVLNFGQMLTCGPPDEIKRNPAVIEAYLGKDE